MSPKTCVITLNYKGVEDTAACVASLQHSTSPVAIVVVDNTPNDPELETALAPYPGVKLIRASENLGFGRGNNLGINWALENLDCEFVLILNNDATVKLDTIKQLETAMEKHPEAGIVTARIVLEEDHARLWYGGGEVDWKRGSGRVPGVLGPADTPLAMQSRYVTFASGCAMMIRQTLISELKGFDERFFMYEEDLELSLRVQELGRKIWYEPSAVVYHIVQGSQKKNGPFIDRYDPKNYNLVFLVYHGMKNSLLNAHLHAKGIAKLKFKIFFPMVVFKRCVKWATNGRIDALKSFAKALRDYHVERR